MRLGAILMYHRVCARTASTEPYFARGTAIEPHVFREQMTWLAQHTDVVTVPELLQARGREGAQRVLVALTFDDGYVDCVSEVHPVAKEHGVPWMVFAPSEIHAESGAVAWVDHYYALLTRARRRQIRHLAWLLGGSAFDMPKIDLDWRWWVRGPPKIALAALTPPDRRRALSRLARELDSDVDVDELARTLYCSPGHLRELAAHRVGVGGHGAVHERLDGLNDADCAHELRSSMTWLRKCGAAPPAILAYPDGGYDDHVVKLTREAGFDAALTVDAGFVTRNTDQLKLPRFIVRNRLPTEPSWCAAFFDGSSASHPSIGGSAP